MRLLPHTIYLMALRGRKSLHGRPLPTPEEAAGMLRRLTGQDFGLDAEKWSAWIRANRRGLYQTRGEDARQGTTEDGPATGTDPAALLDQLRDTGPASPRKFRLFSCACLRHLWPGLAENRFHEAVGTAEEYADGRTTKAALRRARQAIREARHQLPQGRAGSRSEWTAYWLAEVAASENASAQVIGEIERLEAAGVLATAAGRRSELSGLLHCVFGPRLSEPVAGTPSWRTPTVAALAAGAYEGREMPSGHLDAARLGVLADAAEEAGCTDPGLLAHLRGRGPHVRGCWCIDLLLNKEEGHTR